MMSRQQIYQAIATELEAGRPVAQATVFQTRGSTPRKEGSTMLVRQDGTLVGTIGGGCGEAGVIQKARLSLLDGKIREELADLTEDIAVESEGVCGGTQRVFIEPWQPGEAGLALIRTMIGAADGKREVEAHLIVTGGGEDDPALGARLLRLTDGEVLAGAFPEGAEPPGLPREKAHQFKKTGERGIYSERWEPVPALVIVGAGHIAEPLEQFARLTGFRTVVVDDRRLFANRERFPHATQVVCGPILDVVREIEVSRHHYVVLVTRGHSLDMDALRVMLERNVELAYLGMIGSKRRISAVFQLLAQEGLDPRVLGKVHSPVGLNIGAETPAEIAISILAEMIAVKTRSGDDTRPISLLSGVHPALRRMGKVAGE